MFKIPTKKSKPVLEFMTIARDARAMSRKLITYVSPTGKTSDQHFALHHSQFKTDSYNFFVVNPTLFGGKTTDVMVVINPRIIEKSDKKKVREACMSFPFRHGIEVNRYDKILVSYQVPTEDGKDMITKQELIEGFMAQIFQHEIQHGNGSHIYQGTHSH